MLSNVTKQLLTYFITNFYQQMKKNNISINFKYFGLRTIIIICFYFYALSYNLISQNKIETQRKSTALTIYNDNLGVVKENHTVNIDKGLNIINLTNVASQIQPTSVNLEIDAKLLEQNYQYDLASIYSILQKFINKEINLTGKSEINGTLISINGIEIVIQTKEGGIIMIPNLNDYQLKVNKLPENLKTKPTLEWKIESDKKATENLELTYKTNGLSWNAKYVAVLNKEENKINLNSWVNMTNNCGASFFDTKIKLVAGNIKLNNTFVTYDEIQRNSGFQTMKMASEPNFQERTFFDYHIYELERTTDILNNEQKQISLFNADAINVTKSYSYKVNGNNPNGKADIIIDFQNSKKNNLGIPLPKGEFSIYKEDNNSIELVGEDRIDHTPKDEKIELKLGEAFDIVIDDKITSNDRNMSKIANEQIYITDYSITIKNKKDENIIINIKSEFGSNWEVVKSNFKYEKSKYNEIVFPVSVNKNETQELTFKLKRVY